MFLGKWGWLVAHPLRSAIWLYFHPHFAPSAFVFSAPSISTYSSHRLAILSPTSPPLPMFLPSAWEAPLSCCPLVSSSSLTVCYVTLSMEPSACILASTVIPRTTSIYKIFVFFSAFLFFIACRTNMSGKTAYATCGWLWQRKNTKENE